MGYELNRLMQQYGVSTPVLSYSGMQAPVKPADLSTTASTTDRANYDALLAKYNADLPLYQSDQAKYKTYSDDYKNRLATTSMYDAPQFQRGAMSSPGTGMFTDQYSQMYQDVLGRAPDPAGLAYWKGKFGDTISSDEYSEFMQSAQREMGGRPSTTLPVTTARTVLNQPTYSTPTQAAVLQTAANNPVTNETVVEPPAGGENTPNLTPDWGTTATIGKTLSDLGLTTFGDYVSQLARDGRTTQQSDPTDIQDSSRDDTRGPMRGKSGIADTDIGPEVSSLPQGYDTAASRGSGSMRGTFDFTGPDVNPEGISEADAAFNGRPGGGGIPQGDPNAPNPFDGTAPGWGGSDNGSNDSGNYGGNGSGYMAKGGYIKGYEDGGGVGEGFGYGEGAGAAQGAGMGGYGSSGEGYGDFDNISSTMSSRINTQKAINDYDMAMLNQSSRPVVGGYNNAVMVSRESQDSAPYANAYGYQDAQQARDAYDSFVAEQSMSREGAGGNRAKGGYIKGYAAGGPVDSRLYGETDEVATGPGYSVPPIDPRLQSLASKYQQPGFQPRFASGSVDPGQSQMDMIREDALQNGLDAPVINISADKPAMSSNMAALQQMLRATQSQASPYADDLRAARAAANSQTLAFNKMLQDAIKGQEDSGPSKAETYFRLAAAFGAPTKTGHFAEGLAEANKSMAEQAKETRLSNKAGQALKLQLGLEGAKAGMTAAREDVNALRALTGEEMKDKAAYQRELIKDYFTSGRAQSSAGKQAIDEGLVQGSPEFQARVKTISDEEFKKLTAGVDASIAAAQLTMANIAKGDEATRLAREKFDLQQKNAAKLTAPEMKRKVDAEDMIGQTEQAMANLRRAYALNPNTFDTSVIDSVQRKALEAAGSKDPKVIATRELENILERAALSALKATFPGAISDGERKARMATVGLGAKSIEERAKIMMSGYEALKSVNERSKARLKRINEGGYRDTTPSITGEIE